MKFNWNNCGRGCARGLLMAMNGFCVLLALIVFIFAVVDSRILKQYGDEQASSSFAGDMIIICITVLLAGVAVFGCLGAAKENVKMLYFYVIMLLILFLLELLLTVYVSMQRYNLHYRVTEWIREDFYSNVSSDKHQETWDHLQTTYACCGLNGPRDYEVLDRPISLSCCPNAFHVKNSHAQTQMYKNCIRSQTYYLRGCEGEILYQLDVEDDVWFWTAIITFTLEAQGMLLAMWMANNLKRNLRAHKIMVKY